MKKLLLIAVVLGGVAATWWWIKVRSKRPTNYDTLTPDQQREYDLMLLKASFINGSAYE